MIYWIYYSNKFFEKNRRLQRTIGKRGRMRKKTKKERKTKRTNIKSKSATLDRNQKNYIANE